VKQQELSQCGRFRVDQPKSVIGSESQPTRTRIESLCRCRPGAHGGLPRVEARDHRSHILTCLMYLCPMAMARPPFVSPADAVALFPALPHLVINRPLLVLARARPQRPSVSSWPPPHSTALSSFVGAGACSAGEQDG
jgi:hypothetical protein